MNSVSLKTNPPAIVYKAGSIWEDTSEGVFYILALCSQGKFVAICLEDGARWDNPIDSSEAAVNGLKFVCSSASITIDPLPEKEA